uniref:Peptidase S54 rhomboid domain-containing protein n=1 Tax=Arcella intermedia TaxID=1963864 RepID=A0A6B2LAH8_9EUKA|eukprot:TRINITY_DN26739_c0_g1_i1.p1 TRINITY_DN26739_c0_g1~~TRINITY_DN26739_c0_g1_i1.p1  ORF type:complete len:320 (+),score=57.78 TRINITY_DN26739_c0_g1_i1:101-1060(+)
MDLEAGSTTPGGLVPNIASMPRFTRWLVLVVLVLYLVGVVFDVSQYLALVPINFIPRTWLWLIVTTGFYHTPGNLIELLLNVWVILYASPILEPFWGSREMFKIILISNIFAAVCTFFSRTLLYLLFSDKTFLFSPVSGFFAGSLALLVGLKQLWPDKELKLVTLSLRAKYLPFTFLVASILISYISFGHGNGSFELALFGIVSSWIYLRYFHYRDGVKGDDTPQFNFSTLFPEPVQPTIDNILTLCGSLCCRKKKLQSLTGVNSNEAKYSILDSPEDVERRKNLALKILDDKLKQTIVLTPEQPTPDHPDTPDPITSQ